MVCFSAGALAQGLYGGPPAAPPPAGGANIGPIPGGFGVPGVNAPAAAPLVPRAEAPVGPAWTLVPAIEIGQAYNDNVTLAPKGSEKGDFITTITPSLALTGDTSRVHVYLLYDPQALIFDGGTFSPTLQQRLLGLGHAEVWPELLFFDARASIDQEFLSSAGPIGPTTLTTNSNLQTVEATSASPYVLEHFGPYLNSESRYVFSTVTTSGNTVAPEQIHELRQRFSGGEDFAKFAWAITGDATQINRLTGSTDPLGGSQSRDAYAKADLRYPLFPELSVIGSGGYERVSDPVLAVQPHGPIWSAGLAYQPNTYLSAFASYGRRFGQSDVEFEGRYTPDPDLQLRAVYTLAFQTGQSLIVSNLNQATVGPNGTIVNAQTGQPLVVINNATPGTASSAFGVSSGPFFEKRFELDAIATRERNTFSASVYDVKNSGDPLNVSTERIVGTTIGWGRQLWPNLSSSVAGTYYRALFEDGSGRRDNSYTISLGLAYSISPTATARFTVTRMDTMSNVPADSVVNDIVLATIRKQF